MLDSKFMDRLCAKVPKHQRDKFLKYALIIGVDRIAKKGLLRDFDFEAIRNLSAKIKEKGRIDTSAVSGQSSIKREIQNLKHEITNLAKHIEARPIKLTEPSEPARSSSTKNKRSKKEDSRKRASSFDYRRHQEKRSNGVTPKVTEVVPNQIYQHFNINISKHHLDDTEMYMNSATSRKEVFQNQSVLFQNSEQRKKSQPRSRAPIHKTLSYVPSPMPPKNTNKENLRPQDPQRVKEQYELELCSQIHARSQVSNSSQNNLSRSESSKTNPSRKNNTKKIQYDPNAHVNDLPYIQVQPQSKVKEEIEMARRRYRLQQQEAEAAEILQNNVLNTANFAKKPEPSEIIQPAKPYHHPKKDEPIYKSTVTTVLNEENSLEHPYGYESQFNAEREQFSDQANRYLPQHSSQYSQQQTKRSQLSDPRPQSQDFKSKDAQYLQLSNLIEVIHKFRAINLSTHHSTRSSSSLSQNTHRENSRPTAKERSNNLCINKDKSSYHSKAMVFSIPNIKVDLSSQKMSVQLSGQKQSNLWDRGSRQQQRVNPFIQAPKEDDYGRSSVSSNFSMFTPDDELKTFFQKDFIERKGNPSELNSKQSVTSSSQQSDGMQHQYQEESWGKKRSNDDMVRSNLTNKGKISVTRMLNGSQI